MNILIHFSETVFFLKFHGEFENFTLEKLFSDLLRTTIAPFSNIFIGNYFSDRQFVDISKASLLKTVFRMECKYIFLYFRNLKLNLWILFPNIDPFLWNSFSFRNFRDTLKIFLSKTVFRIHCRLPKLHLRNRFWRVEFFFWNFCRELWPELRFQSRFRRKLFFY